MQRLLLLVVVLAAAAQACFIPTKVDTLLAISEVNDCFVDEDCCVVTEPCSARVFLVTADEFDEAKETAEFDEGGALLCNTCTAPITTVACVNGSCQGTGFEEGTVQLAEDTPVSSCGPRQLELEQAESDPTAQTFEQFFGCDGLNK